MARKKKLLLLLRPLPLLPRLPLLLLLRLKPLPALLLLLPALLPLLPAPWMPPRAPLMPSRAPLTPPRALLTLLPLPPRSPDRVAPPAHSIKSHRKVAFLFPSGVTTLWAQPL